MSSSAADDSLGGPTQADPGSRLGVSPRVSRPFLFLVFEAHRLGAGGARYCLEDVDEIIIARGGKRAGRRATVNGKRRLTVTVPTSLLSREHARLLQTEDGWVVDDLDSTNGVFVNGSQIRNATLAPGDILEAGRVYFMLESHESAAASDFDFEREAQLAIGLVSVIPPYAERLARLREVAAQDIAITLVGETGTGKEVLAKAIHVTSGRRGPYIGINCGAIPRTLIQSELFGHVKGAFSDAAADHSGRIRDAHEGTLLLDEVLAAPMEVQIALLRAIQEREVTPVGGKRSHRVDVRFVAAAQRRLADAVADKELRDDLRARLEGFVFELPPLRDRTEDLGTLIANIFRGVDLARGDNPRLSRGAALKLLRHKWPLNIRELALAMTLAWGLAKPRDGEMTDEDFPGVNPSEEAPAAERLRRDLLAHLQATRGNVKETARRIGHPRPVVHRWLKKFGIDADKYRK